MLGRHPLRPLDGDSLLDAARRQTGLRDLGDEDGLFEEGLRRLTEALDRQSALTPMGRLIMREQLVMVIANRLKLVEYSRQHTEVRGPAGALTSPVFTVGMPRAGTTFLHNLLSQDTERFRAMRTWEYVDPVPPLGPDASWLTEALRVLPVAINMMFFRALGPSVTSVYPIGPRIAEECMPVLGMAMVSLQYNTLSNVSAYNDWQMRQPAPFNTHELFFRVLQSAVPPEQRRTWLFKAPWHMNHLEALFKAYPDAKVLMPHRDPAGFLASLSSLHARFYGIVSDDIKPEAIGAYQLKQWRAVSQRYMQQRDSLPPEQQKQILDIQFADLINDPIGAVRRIYDSFGWELTPRAEQAMRTWLETDKRLGKKEAKGKHEYRPEWFGLSESEVAEQFAAYCTKYGVPRKYAHSDELKKRPS